MSDTKKEMSGVELIAAERERQISVEGWTPKHDDKYVKGELAEAAACYARQNYLATKFGGFFNTNHNWPWDKSWWKPSPDPIDNLKKAGALIAAEIDRLQRAKGKKA